MAWTERYVRDDAAGGGDGTTNTNSGANGAWTLAEAIASYASGQRLNVRAGTYSNTTTSRTFGTAGTTTAPIWWRGFNTTIGDIDTDNTLTKPAITFSTGRFIVSAAHQIFSNLDISGAQTTNGQVVTTAANVRFDRCRFECTAANANGRALYITGNDNIVTRCWIKATSSAPSGEVATTTLRTVLDHCSIVGGSHGWVVAVANTTILLFNSFNDPGGDPIRVTAAAAIIAVGNTLYSASSDGIEITSATAFGYLAHNLIANSSAWGINQSSGGNTNTIQRLGNAFYDNSSGTETGFGDSPTFQDVTESGSPFTNAGSGDLSLVSGASSKGVGAPGAHENQSGYTTYLDVGAVQRQEAGGSGGVRFDSGMVGGMRG